MKDELRWKPRVEILKILEDTVMQFSKELIERITNVRLSKNVHQILRKHCSCLPTRDIGYYNSCPNLCKYCYANYDEKTVQKNFLQHDKNSSFLIGNSRPNDIIQQAKQETFKDSQLFMF